MQQQPILLRVPEAAKLLSVSRARAYALIHEGKIPSYDLAGTLRVPYEDLQAMVRAGVKNKERDHATD